MPVRCCCCGTWLFLYLSLAQPQQLFCEGCSAGRFGGGRGQCEYCQLYPTNQEHWKDKRPHSHAASVFARRKNL